MFFLINDLGVFSENSGTPEKTPRNSKHHGDIFNPLVHYKDGYCTNGTVLIEEWFRNVRNDRQKHLLMILTFFFAQMDAECDVDHVETLWTLHDSRIHRIGHRIGSKSIARTICWWYWHFFAQVDAECDVDHAETVLNIARFPDPSNRPSYRVRIDRQNNLLTILTFFFFFGRRMRCWPCRNCSEHCTISGSTESAIDSVPNRRSEQSTGRGFN